MAQSTLRGKRSVPLTTSNVLAVAREVKRWWGREGSWSLTRYLCIPESKQKEIMATFPDEMDQKQQAISYWINTDPLASWRRLVIALDRMRETELADSIRSNVEPLTDDSLTPHSVARAVATVRRFWDIGLLGCLGVPSSVMEQIRDSRSYSSEEEKRAAGLQYCLKTVPGVSWGRIAGMLWYLEEHTAMETVRQYLPHTHDISLTLSNLTSALDSLPDKLLLDFGAWMDVPLSILNKIKSQLSSDKERKAEVLRVISTEHPHLTWEHVSDALYLLGGGKCHHVLERVQSLFPTGKQPPSAVAMAATTPPSTSPDSSTKQLDINDLFEVHTELCSVAAEWKGLGLALRLHPGTLDTIEADCRDVQSRLREVLTQWLKKDYDTRRFGAPSWQLLVAAVAHPAGGNNPALAHTIAHNHNGKQQQSAVSEAAPVNTTHSQPPPTTSQQSTLDIDDYFDVVSELDDVAHVWKSLGGALRLRKPILDRIEKERQNDVKTCLSEMVTEWLNQSYNTERFGLPSWKMLVEAVAHRNGGNNNALAIHIATKYNVPAPAKN